MFNDQGHLIRIQDAGSNYIEFQLKEGKPVLLKDNFNNQVKITWKTFQKSPRITRIQNDKLKASYKYSKAGHLIRAVGIDAVPYAYKYDDEYNMTRVTYSDGTYKKMQYDKLKDWVTRFRDRDGVVSEYQYFSDRLDPKNKFGTIVTRYREKNKKKKEISKFWHEFRQSKRKRRFKYKSVSSVRGIVTETIFTQCCATPLIISQWKDVPSKKNKKDRLAWTKVSPKKKRSTRFKYNREGLLVQKKGPDGTVTKIRYNKKHQRIRSIHRGKRKINYQYAKDGNMNVAIDQQERLVLLVDYNSQGQITVIKEKKGKSPKKASLVRTVFFRYDSSSGQPTEVKEKSANGKESVVRFAYKNGRVQGLLNAKGKPLKSQDEKEAAKMVALTFQKLLEIVQPPELSLIPEA